LFDINAILYSVNIVLHVLQGPIQCNTNNFI